MIEVVRASQTGSRVRHHVAGGTEYGGGIGRLVSYILDADSTHLHRVTDTRGPRWDRLRSPFALLRAALVMIGDRIGAPDRIQHLHIAGRGSTARKLILGALARGLGSPHILHLHDYDYAADLARRPGWYQRAIRHLFRGADLVIVLGNRDRDTVVNLLSVLPDQVRVMHNAVPDPTSAPTSAPTPAPAPAPAKPVGPTAAQDPVVILFLGQLGPRKGVPELLQALADPAMGAGGWRAVLAGDGPVETYRARAARLGLSDRVTLTGWLDRDQTRALCESAGILVLPSHGEGMAMAVLEGLAHGLCVVTTPVGAHPEILTDGETCVFVPVGDPAALAATLADLVANPALRTRIAAAGRAKYAASLCMGAYMDRLDALYRALDRHPQPALFADTGAS